MIKPLRKDEQKTHFNPLDFIYYSRGSVIPAVLAAAKHCYPRCGFEHCAALASAWLRKQRSGRERTACFFKLYGRDREGANLYVLCTAVPPLLVERTLSGLAAALYEGGRLIVVSPLPGWRYKRRRGGPAADSCSLASFWTEIEAAVTRARLQASIPVNERL